MCDCSPRLPDGHDMHWTSNKCHTATAHGDTVENYFVRHYEPWFFVSTNKIQQFIVAS